MYLSPHDMDVIRSMTQERERYRALFGKNFPSFNHDEWFSTKELEAVEVWKEALLDCLKNNYPYVWIEEDHTL